MKKEKDEMEKKVLTPDAIDTMVKDRASLMADAARLAPTADFKGLAVDEIKRKVVVSVRGEDCVKDKSQPYIDAAYDILLTDAPAAGALDTLPGSQTFLGGGQAAADESWKKRVNDMENAYKGEPVK